MPRHRQQRHARWGLRLAIAVAVLLVLVVAAGMYQLLRGVPKLTLKAAAPSNTVIPGGPPTLPWPAGAQAMVDIPGVGTLNSPNPSPTDKPVPIASLTKMMTAYVILHDHPLPAGTPGPGIPMNADDVAVYRSGRAQGESVVRVVAGEMLPERQALEGLLVASGNNLAGALARWDKTNPAAFVDAMNATATQLGLAHTHYADAAGTNPASVSTAAEQLKLAEAAMADPTFAEIVAEQQVNLPLAGTIRNYNTLVGTDGIVGIKTGNSLAAGGCVVVAAKRPIGGHDQLVYASVVGVQGKAPLQGALAAGRALVDATGTAVKQATVLNANQIVGRVRAPWGGSVNAVVADPVQVTTWGGVPVSYTFKAAPLGRSVSNGARVGTLTATIGNRRVDEPVRASGSIHGPSLLWRLKRLP
jgi:D-alanyl-D-alanine carboxypeptidase (penicillin-binding protein 5/6)